MALLGKIEEMKIEVFYTPGQGASDSLMDWLEWKEALVVAKNVLVNEDAFYEGLALGAGQWPVCRKGARVVVGLDYEQIEVLLMPAENVGGGVSVELATGGIPVVIEVAQESAAARAGLQPGDIISGVGGYSAISLSIEQLRNVFGRQDRILAFEIRRDGRTQKLTITP
jgi:membrane-associated protease RseP (regulator of RpoE activity)